MWNKTLIKLTGKKEKGIRLADKTCCSTLYLYLVDYTISILLIRIIVIIIIQTITIAPGIIS